MNEIFSYNGLLYKVCVFIYEAFVLNLLWFIGSVPLITIGASTTALYSVYNKKVNGQSYKVCNDFFKAYKKNIKQASILGTIITIMLCMSLYNMTRISSFNGRHMWLYYMHIFIIFQILLISNYIFPLIDRVNMSITDIIMNAIILAYKNIIISIINITILGVLTIVVLFKPGFVLFFIGSYGLIWAYLIERGKKNFKIDESVIR